ncbi:MAG: aldose epimerase family protein [Vulcanimicrobiaceae bacterium]
MADLTLANTSGMRVDLTSLGAAITGIYVPDAQGHIADVTIAAGGSAGKTIGRYANRIAGGRFSLDGKTYMLPTNEGANTLHGGPNGFSKREWSIVAHHRRENRLEGASFTLKSPDGDQGFPGTMTCSITYYVTDANELYLEYIAATDAPTVVNFTNHVYFNLRGDGSSDISTQELRIAASAYTPLDGALIPTGEIAPVEGTSRDFRTMRPMGGETFDCNFVLDGWNGTKRFAAEAFDPQTGRVLVVETTEPGLQFYTGKAGAFALETQHFADSPHHPNFPSTVLRPGETFRSTTVYRFLAR